MINAKLGTIVNKLGMEENTIRNLIAELGFEIKGNLVLNVVSTNDLITAIQELVLANNNNAKDVKVVEGMDGEMKNTQINNETVLETKGVETMKNNERTIKTISGQLEKGILTTKNATAFVNCVFDKPLTDVMESNRALSLLGSAAEKKYKKNFIGHKAVKYFTKDIPVILTRRVEVNIEKSQTTGKFEIASSISVQPGQESELLRNCKQEEKWVCDNNMSLYGTTVDEIISLSLGESLSSQTKLVKGVVKTLLGIMSGTDSANRRITLVVKPNGLANVHFNNNFTLNEGEEAIEYEILAPTASGLGSRTISMAAVRRYKLNEKPQNVDRRVELLSNSSNQAYKEHFIKEFNAAKNEYVFKNDYTRLDKLFKDMIRLMLPATTSRRGGVVKTYIVFNEFSQRSAYLKDDYSKCAFNCSDADKIVDCAGTTDGAGMVSSECVLENLKANNIPVKLKDIAGLVFQTRGGGTKMSSKLKDRKHLAVVVNSLLQQNVKIEKVVLNGKFIDANDLLNDKNLLNQFLSNIDAIYDTNSMKLLNHTPAFDLQILKQAYTSDTALNTATILSMLIRDEKATIDLLMRRGEKAIESKINELGIFFDRDADGTISNSRIDFARIKGINNDTQAANWFFKSAPEVFTAIAPGIIKSMLKNTSISLKNLINTVKLDIKSKYTVVEPDYAPLYGYRLLADNEIYCPSLAPAKKASGLRHPMSSPFAVTTFNVIDKGEIVKRIAQLDASNEIKEFLMDDYLSIDDYAIIPASLYLMQKHDGMDFDIDAMQIYYDEEVVSILENVPNIGTNIDRDIDVKNNVSTEFSSSDLVIKSFYEGLKGNSSIDGLRRPIATKEVKVDKSNSVNPLLQRKFAIKNTTANTKTNNSQVKANKDGKYSLDFVSIGNLVLDYFLNPIAPIGIITTGEYNNALLYLSLFSDLVSDSDKKNICTIISSKFNCSQKSAYVSPIRDWDLNDIEDGEIKEIILHKEICNEVLFRFAESNGDVQDTIQFLLDALLCNRYVGETSIDSTKNMYKNVDVFNLFGILRALGSDKATSTMVYNLYEKGDEKEIEADSYEINNDIAMDAEEAKQTDINAAVYKSIIEEINESLIENNCVNTYSDNNFFNVALLFNQPKSTCFDITGYSEDQIQDAIQKANDDDMILSVKDPLYLVREALVVSANQLLVLASKELEGYIKSDKAVAIRNEIESAYMQNITSEEKDFFRADSVINSALACYFNISNDLTASGSDEVEKTTVLNYLKTVAKQGCKNYANIAFKASSNTLSDSEIGAAVAFNLISSFNSDVDSCKTINTSMVSMFAKELAAFLNTKGENVIAGEKILYAVDENNNKVNIKNFVDATITADKGHGVLVSDSESVEFVFKNKKASFDSATIIKTDCGYCAIFDREDVKENESAGMYLSLKKKHGVIKSATDSASVDFSKYSKIEFKKAIKVRNTLLKNQFIGYTEDGSRYVVAEAIVNTAVASLLDGKEFNTSDLKVFISNESVCLHLRDEDLIKELSFVINNENNSSDLDVSLDMDFSTSNSDASSLEIDFSISSSDSNSQVDFSTPAFDSNIDFSEAYQEAAFDFDDYYSDSFNSLDESYFA